MVRIISAVLFSLVLCLVWCSGNAAEPNMKGMPSMPATTTTSCLTQKDTVPQKPEKDQNCKTVNTKISGDTVSWTIQCLSKDGTKIDSNGMITYKGDKFEGTVNMQMAKPGEEKIQALQRMTGRRIGECK